MTYIYRIQSISFKSSLTLLTNNYNNNENNKYLQRCFFVYTCSLVFKTYLFVLKMNSMAIVGWSVSSYLYIFCLRDQTSVKLWRMMTQRYLFLYAHNTYLVILHSCQFLCTHHQELNTNISLSVYYLWISCTKYKL